MTTVFGMFLSMGCFTLNVTRTSDLILVLQDCINILIRKQFEYHEVIVVYLLPVFLRHSVVNI